MKLVVQDRAAEDIDFNQHKPRQLRRRSGWIAQRMFTAAGHFC